MSHLVLSCRTSSYLIGFDVGERGKTPGELEDRMDVGGVTGGAGVLNVRLFKVAIQNVC